MNRGLILSLFIILFLGGCTKLETTASPETIVSGEVFIVTQGANNIKLGLVEVVSIPADTFNADIKARGAEIRAAIAKNEEVLRDCQKLQKEIMDGRILDEATISKLRRDCSNEGTLGRGKNLPGLVFTPAPKNAVSTVTNADGKFLLKLPQGGRYAIFAKGQRSVGDKEEKYFWLEIVELKTENQNLILSNNNLFVLDMLKVLVDPRFE
jgi:hypothetical protein